MLPNKHPCHIWITGALMEFTDERIAWFVG